MEPKFQTSFIPKKMSSPIGMPSGAPKKHAGTSILMIVGVLAFLLSLGGAGGAYAWNKYLIGKQDDYRGQLIEREKQFNISLIEQLKAANVKIDASKKLLDNHVAVSQIFAIISQLTIENVRFLSMDLSAPADQQSDGVKVSMHGYGTSFAAIAFQSDILGRLEEYGLRKVVKNPILSDPSLDSNGTVAFGFSATIDPASLSYRKNFTAAPVTDLEPAPAGQGGSAAQ